MPDKDRDLVVRYTKMSSKTKQQAAVSPPTAKTPLAPSPYPEGQTIAIPTMYFIRARLERFLQTNQQWLRDFLGEFIGTTLLVAIICGNAAQAILSRGTAAGKFFPISFVSGMAISFGVYLSGNTSGGHINPAVTMVMVLVGRTTWRMLPIYWLAQYLGAFVGAAVVYAVYYDALNHFDGGVRQVFGPNATAGIFATYPQNFLSTGFGWFDQVVGTAVLTMCIFAVHDERNVELPKHLLPLVVGLVVCLIGMAFGWNCGFPINPVCIAQEASVMRFITLVYPLASTWIPDGPWCKARDLGPRFFTLIAGWGRNVFRYRYYNWFWATLLGPHVGAVLGTIIYMLFVGIHWPTTFCREYQATRKASVLSTAHLGNSGSASRKSSSALPKLSIPEIRVEPESPKPVLRKKGVGVVKGQFGKDLPLMIREDPNQEIKTKEEEQQIQTSRF